MGFFQPVILVSAKSLSSAGSSNLGVQSTMPVKCLINCVNLMPTHCGSWRGLEQGRLRDYYLSGSYGNCRSMGRRGKTKQQFSPTFPQGLENSPPKTLRISHSSHSFGYWLSICSETSQRVFRMIYFSRGSGKLSAKSAPSFPLPRPGQACNF